MGRWIVVAVLLTWVAVARGFQADLIPARLGPATEDLEGSLAITGEDGHIRVLVESLNDDKAEPLDGTVTLELRLKVDGRRRRVALPVVLDTGDGQAETSLNLVPGARVIVRDARLRGPSGRTLATAGLLVESSSATTTTLPPTSDCPVGLAACQGALAVVQSELLDCTEELDLCDESE